MRTIAALLILAIPAGAGELMGPPAPAIYQEKKLDSFQPWGWQEGAIIGASLADLASTELALRNVPGAREANPLMVSTGVRVPLKLAYTGAVVWLYRELERRGQHRWAKTVLVWAVAVWAGAAAWNLSL
jgi:hypothetical protein